MTLTELKQQPLLTPFRLGKLPLPNRIVMAPLTRQRAANAGHVPTKLQAQYYAQRASAGVIISEGTAISPEGYGWADTPGLWSAEQVSSWHVVTDAVHKAGGRIIAQLWHTGSRSHPDLLDGAIPVSASEVNPLQESVTATGRKPTVTPRAMTKAQIRQTVMDYSKAALHAMDAGFDGVQVQANYLYLIPQFLNRATNIRTDEYGGSIQNRARFLFEVLEGILEVVDSGLVGIKIAPMHEKGAFAANDETLPTIEHVITRLNDYTLSHLLMTGASTDFAGSPLAALDGDGMFQHFRPIFKGPLIANVKMDRERGNRLLSEEANLLLQKPGWSDLPAVRANRVFAVNANAYFARPGPRVVDGVELLAHLIHPELFDWNGPANAFRAVQLLRDPQSQTRIKTCGVFGQAFECKTDGCWCDAFPPLTPSTAPGADCHCPVCLAKEVRRVRAKGP